MPKQRYERREPTHEWSQIRPLLKDPTQIHYEILRPIVLPMKIPVTLSGGHLFRGQRHVVAQLFQSLDRPALNPGVVYLLEILLPQVGIRFLRLQHMIDNDQQLVRHRQDGSLLAPAVGNAMIVSRQIGAFGVGSDPCYFA